MIIEDTSKTVVLKLQSPLASPEGLLKDRFLGSTPQYSDFVAQEWRPRI